MYMKSKLILLLMIAGALQGCNKFLEKPPFASLTPTQAFSNASDLALYTNSFYNNQIPTADAIFTGDNTSDYISGNNVPMLMTAQTNANNATSWNWATLRNINYFLENYNNPTIPLTTRNSYAGIARFFRAWFYFNMVKTYGDVPWYGHTLATTDSSLYKPRDPRTLVMDSIAADLDFAIANAPAAKDNSCSLITKWVALALKARVCLFEGTFRKYHTELNLGSTASDWLSRAVVASSQIISSGNYKLHSTGNPLSDYRALFITEVPWPDEMILASVYSTSLKKYHDANAYFYSTTLGNRSSPIKSFVDTYLNRDGSRFTDQPSFDTITFVNEMRNRDLRLQQTYRCNGYKRLDGSSAPPDYSYTFTGYQMLKFMVDDKTMDTRYQNTNSLAIFRYAEILLTLAEAKSELGSFTATDWNNTIGLLRTRAGITNTTYPATADVYLQQNYFPTISDAALLEIRRERGVELMCEGLRFDDIRRWKTGNSMNMPYNGVYVPQLNTPYAMNGDGILNVSFVTATPTSGAIPGVYYYLINGTFVKLTQGDHGNIVWLANATRVWNDKMYYNPIAISDIVLNPNLAQNTGW
jgi:hypothetical protein